MTTKIEIVPAGAEGAAEYELGKEIAAIAWRADVNQQEFIGKVAALIKQATDGARTEAAETAAKALEAHAPEGCRCSQHEIFHALAKEIRSLFPSRSSE